MTHSTSWTCLWLQSGRCLMRFDPHPITSLSLLNHNHLDGHAVYTTDRDDAILSHLLSEWRK